MINHHSRFTIHGQAEAQLAKIEAMESAYAELEDVVANAVGLVQGYGDQLALARAITKAQACGADFLPPLLAQAQHMVAELKILELAQKEYNRVSELVRPPSISDLLFFLPSFPVFFKLVIPGCMHTRTHTHTHTHTWAERGNDVVN